MNKLAFITGKVEGVMRSIAKSKFDALSERLQSEGLNSRYTYALVDHKTENENLQIQKLGMKTDLIRMLECDELHMLPDWKESRISEMERDVALKMAMPIVYH